MAAATTEAAFEELERKFMWEPAVTKWMTDPAGLAAKTLDDFLHLTIPDLDKVVEQSQCQNKLQQGSRLRQAHLSLKGAADAAEILKKKGMDDSDLDQLLPKHDLDDLTEMHYNRYHMTWPSTIAPSDLLVSRISREIEKRLLSVKEVAKVKTQAQMIRQSRKKTKIGERLELLEGDAEEPEEVEVDLQIYLAKMFTLVLAYSIAGIKSAPAAVTPETRGTDTSSIVVCPLDILSRYWYRASEKAYQMGGTAGLQWLQKRDEADRAVWVDRYRNSTFTLGQVIAQVMVLREAVWELQVGPQAAVATGNQDNRRRPHEEPVKDVQSPTKKPTKEAQSPVKGKMPKLADKLRDGTKLCRGFQYGSCTGGATCQKGRHICAAELKSGRVCGGRHAAGECNNRSRNP